MGKRRKRHSAEEKAVILRRHLIDRIPVSDLCEEYGIHPTIFYRWQKAMFEGLPAVFEKARDSEIAALKSRNERLREKLAGKDRVIARITEDYIDLKKTLGED
jgi:transposase